MKTRKSFACIAAVILSLTAVPVLSVSAEGSTYAQGDVDMDGTITGHDSAMVSRHLLDSTYTLTDTQLSLADMNGDGTVNQADADAIHQNEVYALGRTDDTNTISMDTAAFCLAYYRQAVEDISSDGFTFTQTELNLLDVDADGKVTLDDAGEAIHAYILESNGAENGFFPTAEQYYLNYGYTYKKSWDEESYYAVKKTAGDIDCDGAITGHDSAMLSRHLLDSTYTLTDEQFSLADMNGDGVLTQVDLDEIQKIQTVSLGAYEGSINADGAYEALLIDAKLAAGYPKIGVFKSAEDAAYDVTYNLLDMNADLKLTAEDAYLILESYAKENAGA